MAKVAFLVGKRKQVIFLKPTRKEESETMVMMGGQGTNTVRLREVFPRDTQRSAERAHTVDDSSFNEYIEYIAFIEKGG